MRSFAKRVSVILSIVGLLFFEAQPVFAYQLLGGRWPNQPHSGCCLQLNTYIYGPITNYDRTAWWDGMTAWNVSPANVTYSGVTSSTLVNLTDTYDNSDWDGLTSFTPCPGSGCTYSYVNSWLNFRLTSGYTAAQTQSVSAHELGHIAGLDHASGCVLLQLYTSIRYSASCGYINTPQTDDINGVNAQY